MLAGRGLPLPRPLPPGVDRDLVGQQHGFPGSVVDLHLDGRHPRVLGPRRPADGDVPCGQARAGPGHLDPRGGLDGPELRPSPLGPVRLLVGEPGDLQVDEPLGRRDVAVEPRDDHAHGEAVLEGQGLAVHADGEHRVAVVGEDRQRGGGGEPVGAAGQDHVRPGERAGHGQDLTHRQPQPPGVAGEVTADRVGHAGQRDEGLDEVGVEELGERHRDLALDEPVHAQRPRLGVDLRDDERGVDPVEVVVGRDDVCHAGHGGLGACRHRGRGAGRSGQGEQVAGRRCRPPHRPGDRAGHGGQDGDRRETGGELEERAAVGGDRRGVAGVRPAEASHEHGQADGSDRGSDEARNRGERRGVTAGRRGDRADAPERQDGARPGMRCTVGQHPRRGGQDRDDHHHADQQGGLVVDAERRDRGVLEPAGREVDEGVPHCSQRARAGIEEGGDEVRRREGHQRADHPRQCREAAGIAVGARPTGDVRHGRVAGGWLLRPMAAHPVSLTATGAPVTCSAGSSRRRATRRRRPGTSPVSP